MSRVALGSMVKKLIVVLGRLKVAVPVWMMTESIGEFGAAPLFQFARAVGHAPVPFQIKTVDAGVGSFDVVMLVFGSSPPITGVRGRLELNVLSSPLPFSLAKLNRGLPPSS